MPGFTPVFGIQYPCAGETIDAAVFQTFADDVEAALATVDVASAAALQRPRAAVRNPSQSIAAGAMTTLTNASTDFATGVTAAASGFTIVTDGIYLITGQAGSPDTTTTVTSYSLEALQAGTVVYRRKLSPFPAVPLAGFINIVGVIRATAGQAITFRWGWTGAGVNLVVSSRATIRKISDL